MLIGGRTGTVADGLAFWTLFLVWVVGELWLYRYRRLPPTATARDRGSRGFLFASVWTAVVGGLVAAVRVPGAAIPFAPQGVFVGGLTLMAVGIGVRALAVAQLGSAFTVTIGTQPGQLVCSRGMYRWVRHPSYTGSLVTVAGLLACTTNVIALALMVLPVLGYAHRIRVEERALIDGLGEAYRAYMRRTKRLIPLLL